ncbi:MAG: hypothetical protein ACRENP_07695 [Longimicrobiales bacterium]
MYALTRLTPLVLECSAKTAPARLPRPLRRALYWVVGVGLLISGAAIWDTTYETIVLNTAADASFAAFYTILIPAPRGAGIDANDVFTAVASLALARCDPARSGVTALIVLKTTTRAHADT